MDLFLLLIKTLEFFVVLNRSINESLGLLEFDVFVMLVVESVYGSNELLVDCSPKLVIEGSWAEILLCFVKNILEHANERCELLVIEVEVILAHTK